MKYFYIIFTILFAGAAFASGDEITQRTNVDIVDGDSVMKSALTGGSHKSFAYSAAGNGDVDINNCRESTQFNIFIFAKQDVRLNPWCAAVWYDAQGKPEIAAKMRCSIKEVRALFETLEICTADNKIDYVPPSSSAKAARDRDDEDDTHDLVAAVEQKTQERLAYVLQSAEDAGGLAQKVINEEREREAKDAQRRAIARGFLNPKDDQ